MAEYEHIVLIHIMHFVYKGFKGENAWRAI